MTADEWLAAHADPTGPRRPWDNDDGQRWFWFPPDNNDPDEQAHVLPKHVFLRLEARTTYPDVKMYKTQAEALADFRQAFDRAVAAGWRPE